MHFFVLSTPNNPNVCMTNSSKVIWEQEAEDTAVASTCKKWMWDKVRNESKDGRQTFYVMKLVQSSLSMKRTYVLNVVLGRLGSLTLIGSSRIRDTDKINLTRSVGCWLLADIVIYLTINISMHVVILISCTGLWK